MGVIMRMMVVGMAFTVSSCDGLGRGEDESASLDALGTDQVVGEVTDLPGWPAQQDHFQTSLVVEMNVSCGDDSVEMIVLYVGEPPGDTTDMMVINQGHDAHRLAVVVSDRFLDQRRPHQAADGLAPIGITVQLAITIEKAK